MTFACEPIQHNLLHLMPPRSAFRFEVALAVDGVGTGKTRHSIQAVRDFGLQPHSLLSSAEEEAIDEVHDKRSRHLVRNCVN